MHEFLRPSSSQVRQVIELKCMLSEMMASDAVEPGSGDPMYPILLSNRFARLTQGSKRLLLSELTDEEQFVLQVCVDEPGLDWNSKISAFEETVPSARPSKVEPSGNEDPAHPDSNPSQRKVTDRLINRMSCFLNHKHRQQFLDHMNEIADDLRDDGESERVVRRFCFWQMARYAGLIRWAGLLGWFNMVWQVIKAKFL